MRQTLLFCLLYLVYFLALGLNVVADAITQSPSRSRSGMIPPPKCGSTTCECGCNSGEDCRCALPE